jgi:hypothetical protein
VAFLCLVNAVSIAHDPFTIEAYWVKDSILLENCVKTLKDAPNSLTILCSKPMRELS